MEIKEIKMISVFPPTETAFAPLSLRENGDPIRADDSLRFVANKGEFK
jgi:hypothetical protein